MPRRSSQKPPEHYCTKVLFFILQYVHFGVSSSFSSCQKATIENLLATHKAENCLSHFSEQQKLYTYTVYLYVRTCICSKATNHSAKKNSDLCPLSRSREGKKQRKASKTTRLTLEKSIFRLKQHLLRTYMYME